MSTTIDQRVVEMRFDNKHFEANVATTMSTLDKLKQRLNLSGATKGLENVSAATKNVNMAGLGSAVEAVQTKFSALQVVGVTALANITNSAVNAGKRMISALTIDPVKTGFQEYETQINAVQTILANTSSKGTGIDQVNKALEELNAYADKTIYNFTEMTRNIGTFTAAGIDLETSVSAIQGIANLAAVSGSTSQQASTAMYQLSQALAAGKVQLMDWNSVVNAGMGGEVFQNALIRTAAALDGQAKSVEAWKEANIDSWGSFRESLSKGGWLTTDVLTKTLEQFTMAAEEGSKEWEKYKKSLMMEGYTEKQAEEILKMANTATDAATKVKTFTQLWDVLKESAQSGWSQTWKTIVGDFEEAKGLLTPLADFLTGFINKMSDARNKIVEGVLDFATPWKTIMDKLDGAGLGGIKKIADTISDATDKLEYFQDIVNKVWRGDYKNSDTGRYELLDSEGYDHRVVQDLVNKGYQYKITVEDIEASHKKFGLTMEKSADSTKAVNDALASLTDEELRNAGLTDDEISLFRSLQKEAERTGVSMSDLADEMSKMDGRGMLIDSFKNIGSALLDLCGIIKDAWTSIFPPTSFGDKVVQLYNLLKTFKEFTSTLRLVDEETGELTETGDKLRRTFEGIFAALDIVTTILGGAFKIAFKTVTSILGYFNLDILDLTARIGDVLVGFRDFIDSILDVTKVLDKLVPMFKDALEAFKDWAAGLKETDNIPKYIIMGLVNGLVSGVKAVGTAAVELAKSILESVCNFLGIHSPSTKFIEVGKNIIDGLVLGVKDGATAVWNVIKAIAGKMVEIIKGIDFGKIFAAAIGTGLLVSIIKIANIVEKFAAPFEGLGDMLSGAGEALEGLGASFKASAWEKKSRAMLNVAISIGILAAAVAVLAKIETGDIIKATVTLGVLAAAIAGVTVVLGKLSSIGNISISTMSIVGISAALLLLATTMKKLSALSGEDITTSLLALVGMVGALSLLLAAFGTFVKGKSAMNIGALGSTLLGMSAAMLIMTHVMKQAAQMEGHDIAKGLAVVAALEALFAGIIALSKIAGKNGSKAGSMILKMSVAFVAMLAVIKLASMLDGSDIAKGLTVVATLELLFAGIIAVSKFAGQNGTQAGSMLLLMSGAMLIMTQVIKQIADLSNEDIKKGLVVVGNIEILFAAIIAVSKFAGENAVKAGTMLLLMSGAILILTGVLFILSKMDPSGLYRALTVVSVLELLFGGIIYVSSLVTEDVKGTLITITVAITLLAAAIVALSFLDPSSITVATAAISAVMGTFAVLVAACSLLKDSKSLTKTLIPIVGTVAILAAIITAMSVLGVEAALETSASLSLLLTTMAATMLILKEIGPNATSGLGALAVMGLIVGELAAILGVLAYFNVEPSISTAVALGLLLTSMASTLAILKLVGPAAFVGIGALAVLGLVVGELAAILGLMAHFDINPSIETAGSLSLLLVSMSAALVLLGAAGTLGPAAFVGIGALATLIAGIGGLVVGIGALMDKFPALEEFLDKGIPIISKIGTAIGSFFGNIVGGLAGGVIGGVMGGISSGIPKIGEDLSLFMTNLQPFVEGAKQIDSTVTDGVKNVAEAMLTLTGANLLQQLGSWLGGSSSLTDFSGNLPQLGTDLNAFAANLGTFTESQVETIACAGNALKTLAEAASSIPNEGGWAAAICGDNSIAAFSGQLPGLAVHLNAFAASLGNFDDTSAETIKCAIEAIAGMAEAASSIPNEGGWAAAICGDNSIATFGSHLPGLAINLTSFATNLGEFGKDQVEAVKCAIDAIAGMAEAASSIPNEGGWAAAICGDNSIATFGSHLPGLALNLNAFATNLGDFGPDKSAAVKCAIETIAGMAEAAKSIDGQAEWAKALCGDNSLATFSTELPVLGMCLNAFATNLGSFGNDKVSSIDCAVRAIKAMATVANSIDGQSEWAKKLFGDNSIAAFGALLPGFATNLSSFASNLGTFGKDKVSTVDSAVRAIKAFASLAGTDLKGAKNNIEGFGGKLVDFAKDIKKFCDNMPSGDSINTATKNLKQVMNSVKDLGKVDSDVAQKFTKNLSDIGKEGVNSFVKAFTNSTAKNDVTKAGNDLIMSIVDGVKAKTPNLKEPFTTANNTAITAIRNSYTGYYNAGMYVVTGFANGITANTYVATAKARAMAQAAASAAQAALHINSPSKVFMKIGSSIPEGFAMGIERLSSLVGKSTESMTGDALSGVKDSLARISAAVNSDMDVAPTIRPVLDLSAVQSRAKAISGLLNSESTVSATVNAGAVSTMMSSRGQNGNNSDIVSAINKLRNDVNSMERTTYHIDGITYDDGSNIADAVQTLVRAAKVGRRT